MVSAAVAKPTISQEQILLSPYSKGILKDSDEKELRHGVKFLFKPSNYSVFLLLSLSLFQKLNF